VGAVFARGASRVHGIKLVYMRIAGASLDPRDAYESEWLGERAPGDVKLGGDGNYVLGVFGGAADDVDRMGIVQLDRSAGGPAPAGPGRGGAVAPLPPGAIDLLAMVDPEKDALKGEWRFEGRSATVSGDMVLRLQMPYVFPDEYDFIVDVERLADHFLVLGLPFEQGGFNVAFDISGRTAVDVVDGIHADRPDNPSAVAGRAIEIRKPSRIVCAVRKSGLQVSVNGKTLLQWTDWSRVRPHPEWKVRDAGTAFVGCQHPFFRFNAVAVVPVRGVGRPLRSAPAPRGSVDLLALVDPARDAVKGSWTRTSRGLQSPPTVDNLLQVPYAAPDEYDLEAVVEWKDGPDGMGFGLVGGGRQVMLMIGSWHQARNGLRFVDDKMENEHEAAFPGAVFRKGKPVLFRFAVRKGTLEVLVDGRRAWLWKADWTRVSAGGFATPESEAFALCSLFGTYEVSRLTLMPVTGTGRPLR